MVSKVAVNLAMAGAIICALLYLFIRIDRWFND
jgi:hypothetical protein